jgi:eukaryotic-like serine/threonine-protein kinase
MRQLLDSTTSKRHSGPAQVETTELKAGLPITLRAPVPHGAARLVAGRYRLRALLGRGGMGRVWLAEDELLHRPVALKQAVLSERTSDDWYPGDNPDRLLIEACAAATVNHKGAVTIYDVVTDDSRTWIVMEPLSGRTLAESITMEGSLSIARVTHIGLRLLDVLMAAHRVGILHCDVKPANVHLCDDGRVVLTDFGIACSMLDEASDRTQMLAGSPLYTAPERLRGGNPEPACDMFSLGATLFAAVEGKPPFSGSSLFDTVIAVVEGEPAPCLHAGPLRAVIEGLLAKNPADRLTGDQARAALVDLQQRLRPGAVTEVVEGGVNV